MTDDSDENLNELKVSAIEREIFQSFMGSPNGLKSSSSSDSSHSLSTSSGSSLLDEDSEDEAIFREKHLKTENYFEITVASYSEADFKRHFRMSRISVTKLCILLEKNYIGGWPEISIEKAVHICLYYLPNRNTFMEVADKFNITESACFSIIIDITKKIKRIKWDNDNLTHNQRSFNQRISKYRNIVEHAFGLLKGRFRRLIRLGNKKIDIVISCVVAAVVLHNFCIKWDDLGEDFLETEDIQVEEGHDDYFQVQAEDCRRDGIYHMLYN
ncbi:hypothetical protein NQ314_004661 [Rhamnusium bicolor]|uniref:DDE Tnp4 domain-containing protein n=1 Tax=Rhamnusium bicolor TaxID=1586634 RepID=A0AAV8ZIW7_9CUCU|nr:hypothetical protein NQ314_004661 [Rhamnusium bicolor]